MTQPPTKPSLSLAARGLLDILTCALGTWVPEGSIPTDRSTLLQAATELQDANLIDITQFVDEAPYQLRLKT